MNYAAFCALVLQCKDVYAVTLPGIQIKVSRAVAIDWAIQAIAYSADGPHFKTVDHTDGRRMIIGVPKGHGTEVTP